MKYQKIIIYILASVLFIACNEQIEIYFSEYESLKGSGQIVNAWIPGILPDDSKEIKVVYNPENNHAFGAFYYQSDNFENLLDSLDQGEIIELEKLLKEINVPNKPKWFPDIKMLHDKKLSLYYFDDFIFVVKKIDSQVYFVL